MAHTSTDHATGATGGNKVFPFRTLVLSGFGNRSLWHAGCSNRPSSKAAGESKPEAYHFSPAHPKLPRQLVLHVGYVEDFDEPRTLHGKRRVSTRLGRAGEKNDYFSILQS
ncbi:MAG: hypothetical protein JW395_3700 [Nitrospira sp.]|nr:hypothetical protein [Nitrospira sp.]